MLKTSFIPSFYYLKHMLKYVHIAYYSLDYLIALSNLTIIQILLISKKVNYSSLESTLIFMISPFRLQRTSMVRELLLRATWTWALLLWPTRLAAAVHEPTMLYVIERGFNVVFVIYESKLTIYFGISTFKIKPHLMPYQMTYSRK